MTAPGVIQWVYQCGGQIAQGDGISCLTKASPANFIIFVIIIALIILAIITIYRLNRR